MEVDRNSILFEEGGMALLALLFIGFFLLAAIVVFGVVLVVVAALKANNGENFRYPVTIRFIKQERMQLSRCRTSFEVQ